MEKTKTSRWAKARTDALLQTLEADRAWAEHKLRWTLRSALSLGVHLLLSLSRGI